MVGIDSLTIMTPFGVFYEYPEIFDELLTVDNSTGEILESRPKPVIFESNGVKLRCWITNVFEQKYVSFTFTSKMLGRDYLTGINKNNLFHCFEFARHTLKFSADYREFFLRSICLDIDFKRDFYQTDKDFTTRMREIKRSVSYARIFQKKANFIDETNVSGLQFVNRKDANIEKPFVKFYDKYEELKTNSSEFFDAYLNDARSRFYNLKRQEVTIRNSDHLRSVLKVKDRDVKVNSLEFVFSLDTSRIDEIIDEVTARHFFISNLRKPVNYDISKFMKPRDFLIVMMMRELMISQNWSMKECFLLLNEYPALLPTTKSRIIRAIKSHFKQLLTYQELENLTVNPNDAFGLKKDSVGGR